MADNIFWILPTLLVPVVVGAVFLLDRKYDAETPVLTTDPGVYEQGAKPVSDGDLRPPTAPAPADSKPSLTTTRPQTSPPLTGTNPGTPESRPQPKPAAPGGNATSATATQKPAIASNALPSAVSAANPGLAPPVPVATKPAATEPPASPPGKPKEEAKPEDPAKPAPATTAAATPAPDKPKAVAPAQPVEPKPKPAPKPPKPAPKEYTVRSGDNPWDIAQKYGVEMKDLLALNNIKNPKNLKIGQVLKLPEKSSGGGSTAAAKPRPKPAVPTVKKPAASDKYTLYTIKKGENPWSIAKKLKVSHQSIIDLNKNLDFRDLKIGQEIKVPKK